MINNAELSRDNLTQLNSETLEPESLPVAYLKGAGDSFVEISTASDSSLPDDDPTNTAENT